MLGKHFRLLFSVSLLLISAESEALTIQSGSSLYYFNTNSPKPVAYHHSKSEREFISGPYVSANLGYAWQNGSESSALYQGGTGAGDFLVYTPGNLRGLFEQLSFGYAFNEYVSLEFGGMHFDNDTYQITSYDNANKTGQNESPANTTVKTYAADVLLKLSVPIQDATGLSLFAAGGSAYQNASFNSNFTGFPSSSVSLDGLTTSTRNTGFVAMASAGIAYAFTRHFSVLANYDYLFGRGTISKNYSGYIPSASIATAGIMATF